VTEKPVLRTRHAAAVPAAQPAPPPRPAAAPDLWEQAAQLARAREILPKAYAANPGTIWLVLGWADAQGVDPLTAIYGVSFVNNRPVVDARLQSALAERAGYRIKVEHADDESATVAVIRDGEILGRTTYTMDDARRAGLAGRDNYRRHPRRMLVARARTEAISFHAPSVGVGLSVADDGELEVDGGRPVEPAPVAPPSADPTVETPPRGRAAQVAADERRAIEAQVAQVAQVDEPVDAEIVDDDPTADPPDLDAATADEPEPEPTPSVAPAARARGEARAAVEHTKAVGRYADLVAAMQAAEIPTAQSRWTVEHATRIVELAETLTATDRQETPE
jgi:hypothetical protein